MPIRPRCDNPHQSPGFIGRSSFAKEFGGTRVAIANTCTPGKGKLQARPGVQNFGNVQQRKVCSVGRKQFFLVLRRTYSIGAHARNRAACGFATRSINQCCSSSFACSFPRRPKEYESTAGTGHRCLNGGRTVTVGHGKDERRF